MSVESRMDEFLKVADKQNIRDVSGRMSEFEQVEKVTQYPSKDRFGTLPYGIKKVKSCPDCGEFIEIQEIKDNTAIYFCEACGKNIYIALHS